MWILYGLLAASSFGVAAIFQKLAARAPIASSPWEVLILQGVTTILVGVIGFLAYRETFTRQEVPAYLWGALTGVTLALGSYFIFMTYTKAGPMGDASRIQALINTNTLIAVVLGLIVLREWTKLTTPADWVRLIVGAILVVLGGVLVSMPPKQEGAKPVAGAQMQERHIHPHATHTHPQIHRTPKHESEPLVRA